MKKLAIIIAIFVQTAFADESTELARFKAQLEQAIHTKSTKGIAALFHTNGASQIQIDQAVYRYEFNWNENSLSAITFKDPSDPKYQNLVEPGTIVMNGHTYVRNLTPNKLCLVTWKNSTDNEMTFVSPIGIAPDGSFKFMLQVPDTKAQQGAAANP